MSHRELYPSLEPYDHGFLQVSPVHSLYYEQSGNPQGNPGKHGFQTKIPHADRMYPKVVYLHGGPGGGTSPDDRRYFNPELYRIVVFDQRGAGKSTPYDLFYCMRAPLSRDSLRSACLEENTTWDLVEDIERLRKHLKIEKWVVFGGSWGSTLSLSYAIKHADCVKGLILRGIFTLRKRWDI
jgi:proline iminopeptidase